MMKKILKAIYKVRYLIIILILSGIFYSLAVPFWIYKYGTNRIYVDIADVEKTSVGIVFGASVLRNEDPSKVLRDRLSTAADLYSQGKIKAILVSGDNRTDDYNEPEVMYQYLINELGVPENRVYRDYAGLRTFDTCKRAIEIWSVDKAVLISQGYHLPRAIFICDKLGIESHGFSATREKYHNSDFFEFREIFALHKAFFDVYVKEPTYIGGEKEENLSLIIQEFID